MTLETSFERVDLPLATPFTIARGTKETVENVVVRLRDDRGTVGVGAALPSSYYGETVATVERVLPDLLAVVEDVADPHARQRIEREMATAVGGNPAARCAVDIALADLAAKRLGLPCYRQWGLDPDAAPVSSYSLGIDDPATMREAAERAAERGFSVLKVKLGPDLDLNRERVAAVRAGAPDARLRVDANEAWTPSEAVETTDVLAEHDVEFVEQPVPADDVDGLRFVREHGALPVAADEAVTTAADVPRVADAVDVVVAKPMKAGSLDETRRVATAARAHGCEAMIGCMVGTNAALAASCHLAPLFDHADLDGALLLERDAFEGIPMPGGRIDLAGMDRPGAGAVPRDGWRDGT